MDQVTLSGWTANPRASLQQPLCTGFYTTDALIDSLVAHNQNRPPLVANEHPTAGQDCQMPLCDLRLNGILVIR